MANAEDRLAIARSVTASIVVIVLSVIGIATAVSNYIVRPQTAEILNRIAILESNQETMKRSNATHFGQIKSLLKE